MGAAHMVLSADLNHHGTLFAGQMAKWVVEACLIEAASFVGDSESLVCVNIAGLTFKYPVEKGASVHIDTAVARVGTTSLTVAGSVRHHNQAILDTEVVFVTLGPDGVPAAHGLRAPTRG